MNEKPVAVDHWDFAPVSSTAVSTGHPGAVGLQPREGDRVYGFAAGLYPTAVPTLAPAPNADPDGVVE